jgi:hypothetical protein
MTSQGDATRRKAPYRYISGTSLVCAYGTRLLLPGDKSSRFLKPALIPLLALPLLVLWLFPLPFITCLTAATALPELYSTAATPLLPGARDPTTLIIQFTSTDRERGLLFSEAHLETGTRPLREL